LINDAVWVPSGSNNQPWRFVVITDKEKLKEYSDTAKKRWLENLENTPYMQQYEKALRNPNYNVFYNAPAVIAIFGDTASYWHVYDCSMVAQNLHILSEEAGLGCCWIGFAHNIFDDTEIKKELGIPENFQLVAPLILGHPAKKTAIAENPNKRKPFEIRFM
jgi:nitroreductase